MTLAQQIQESYDQLGLPNGASLGEVKTAYRRLAKQLHPDRNQGSFDRVMARINQAYQKLNQHLNQGGHTEAKAYAFEEFQAQAAPRPQAHSAPPPRREKAEPNPKAVVRAYSAPTSAAPRGREAYTNQVATGPVPITMDRAAGWRLLGLEKQGDDLVYRVEIKGEAHELALPVRQVSPCRLCSGKGMRHMHGKQTICPACAGQGKTTRSRMVRAGLPDDWAPGRRFPVPAGKAGGVIWVEPIAPRTERKA